MPKPKTKKFKLSVVLALITQQPLATHKEVFEILNWMYPGALRGITSVDMRIKDFARVDLSRQHRDLAEFNSRLVLGAAVHAQKLLGGADLTRRKVAIIMQPYIKAIGKTVAVAQLPEGSYIP